MVTTWTSFCMAGLIQLLTPMRRKPGTCGWARTTRPAKKKRNYWVHTEQAPVDGDADRWFDTAESVPGSRWPRWNEWPAQLGGTQINARKKLGNAKSPRSRTRRERTSNPRPPDANPSRLAPGLSRPPMKYVTTEHPVGLPGRMFRVPREEGGRT